MSSLVAPIALLAMLTVPVPLIAQEQSAHGVVFALMDQNEWCPGGSVYLDTGTGSFMLYPRVPRPRCTDPGARQGVVHGILAEAELDAVRSALAQVHRAGMKKDPCELVVSNGGPQALAVTGPAFSDRTPEQDGCWSDEAMALHDALFRIFGRH